MIVPIMEVEWLVTRESFPAPFVSLAVKGSKLETEMMEDLAFWLSVSFCLCGWEQRAGRCLVPDPPGREVGGLGGRDEVMPEPTDTRGSLSFEWSKWDPESRYLR